jgi:tetratricopeptide (TPR) repeat protein
VPQERLDSWKSIAEYMRRSPRTVQRWHGEHNLPVHHFGGNRGPVFAYPAELDTWLSGFNEAAGDPSKDADGFADARHRRAQELIAEASALWDLRGEQNLSRIASLFRSAIDQDPADGDAFLGLADAILLSALLGSMRCSAAYPRVTEALSRALRLSFDPLSARCTAAWLQMTHQRKGRQAREGFDAVLAGRPRCSHALSGRAMLHLVEGNAAGASARMAEAWEISPFSPALSGLRCWVEYLAGDFELALELAAQARASGESGSFVAAVEALCLVLDGIAGAARENWQAVARESFPDPVCQGAQGYALAVSGETAKAWEVLQTLRRMRGDSGYAQALVLCGLEDKAQAVACLEASFAEGSLWSLGFGLDPMLHSLRGNARFAALRRKIGMGR